MSHRSAIVSEAAWSTNNAKNCNRGHGSTKVNRLSLRIDVADAVSSIQEWKTDPVQSKGVF